MLNKYIYLTTMKNLISIIDKFKNNKIMVLGDVMLDTYIIGDVNRISPEAPVPILEVKKELHIPGGAANVASNIASLGAAAYLFGLCGEDMACKTLKKELKKRGISTDTLFIDNDRLTTEKCRIVSSSPYQPIVRHDREVKKEMPRSLQRIMLSSIKTRLEEKAIGGILLVDYAKGFFSYDLAQKIIGMARRNEIITIVNPKPLNINYFKHCSVIRSNRKETEDITRINYDGEISTLKRMAKKLADITSSPYAIISCGEDGMLVYDKNNKDKKGKTKMMPTRAREISDVVGAGDTLVAALSLGLINGLNIYDAAELANYASGIVISKRGTATVTHEELEKVLHESLQ